MGSDMGRTFGGELQMAQKIGKLSAVEVKMLKDPGYYSDGGCLYFRVAKTGARGWIFRFTSTRRTRDMGLGSYPEISLASARDLAEKFRKVVQQGIDRSTSGARHGPSKASLPRK